MAFDLSKYEPIETPKEEEEEPTGFLSATRTFFETINKPGREVFGSKDEKVTFEPLEGAAKYEPIAGYIGEEVDRNLELGGEMPSDVFKRRFAPTLSQLGLSENTIDYMAKGRDSKLATAGSTFMKMSAEVPIAIAEFAGIVEAKLENLFPTRSRSSSTSNKMALQAAKELGIPMEEEDLDPGGFFVEGHRYLEVAGILREQVDRLFPSNPEHAGDFFVSTLPGAFGIVAGQLLTTKGIGLFPRTAAMKATAEKVAKELASEGPKAFAKTEAERALKRRARLSAVSLSASELYQNALVASGDQEAALEATTFFRVGVLGGLEYISLNFMLDKIAGGNVRRQFLHSMMQGDVLAAKAALRPAVQTAIQLGAMGAINEGITERLQTQFINQALIDDFNITDPSLLENPNEAMLAGMIVGFFTGGVGGHLTAKQSKLMLEEFKKADAALRETYIDQDANGLLRIKPEKEVNAEAIRQLIRSTEADPRQVETSMLILKSRALADNIIRESAGESSLTFDQWLQEHITSKGDVAQILQQEGLTSSVFRETNLEFGEALLPTSNTSDNLPFGAQQEFFVSDSLDLALGQGDNTGVVIELDPTGLNIEERRPVGQPQEMAEKLGTEKVILSPSSQGLRNSVKSVTVKPGAKGDKAVKSRFNFFASQLVKQGWTKTILEDGSIKYTRPENLELHQERPGFSPQLEKIETARNNLRMALVERINRHKLSDSSVRARESILAKVMGLTSVSDGFVQEAFDAGLKEAEILLGPNHPAIQELRSVAQPQQMELFQTRSLGSDIALRMAAKLKKRKLFKDTEALDLSDIQREYRKRSGGFISDPVRGFFDPVPKEIFAQRGHIATAFHEASHALFDFYSTHIKQLISNRIQEGKITGEDVQLLLPHVPISQVDSTGIASINVISNLGKVSLNTLDKALTTEGGALNVINEVFVRFATLSMLEKNPQFLNQLSEQVGTDIASSEDINIRVDLPIFRKIVKKYLGEDFVKVFDDIAGDPDFFPQITPDGLGFKSPSTRGMVQLVTDGKFILKLAKDADIFTVMHEMAHIFFRSLSPQHQELVVDFAERTLGAGRAEVFNILQIAKRDPGALTQADWTTLVSIQESFAKDFEKFLRNRKGKSTKYREIFNAFKQWGLEIFKGVKETGDPVSPEFHKVFTEFFLDEVEILSSEVTSGPKGKLERFKIVKRNGQYQAEIARTFIEANLVRLSAEHPKLAAQFKDFVDKTVPQGVDNHYVNITDLIFTGKLDKLTTLNQEILFGNKPRFRTPKKGDIESVDPDFQTNWSPEELARSSNADLNKIAFKHGLSTRVTIKRKSQNVLSEQEAAAFEEKQKENRSTMIAGILDSQAIRQFILEDPDAVLTEENQSLLDFLVYSGERFAKQGKSLPLGTATSFKEHFLDAITTRIRDFGGELAELLYNKSIDSNDEFRRYTGLLANVLEPFVKLTRGANPVLSLKERLKGSPDTYRRARISLTNRITVGQFAQTTKFELFKQPDLYDDIIKRLNLSLTPVEQEIMNKWYTIAARTGKHAEDAGLINYKLEKNPETEEKELVARPFIADSRGWRSPHQFTQQGLVVLLSESEAGRRALARAIHELNPDIPVDKVISEIKSISKSPNRHIGMEFARSIPRFPSHIVMPRSEVENFALEAKKNVHDEKVLEGLQKQLVNSAKINDMGITIEILESEPMYAAQHLVRNTAIRLGFIKNFPQTKGEINKIVDDFAKVGASSTEVAKRRKLAGYLMRALNGVPLTDSYGYLPGSKSYIWNEVFEDIMAPWKAGVLGMAWARNLPETMARIPEIVGWRNYLKAGFMVSWEGTMRAYNLFANKFAPRIAIDLQKSFVHQAMRSTIDAGARAHVVASWILRRDPGDPLKFWDDMSHIIASHLLLPVAKANQLNEVIAGLAAIGYVNGLRSHPGNSADRMNLQLMGFTDPQIEEIVSGQPGRLTDDLAQKIISRMPMHTQGTNLTPSELSLWQSSPKFGGINPNNIFSFWSYWRRTTNTFIDIYKTFDSGGRDHDPEIKRKAFNSLGRLFGTYTASGLIGTALLGLTKHGNVLTYLNWQGDDDETFDEDMLWLILTEGFFAATVSGQLEGILYQWRKKGETNPLDIILGITSAHGMVTDFVEMVHGVVGKFPSTGMTEVDNALNFFSGNPGRYKGDTAWEAMLKFITIHRSTAFHQANTMLSTAAGALQEKTEGTFVEDVLITIGTQWALGNRDTKFDFARKKFWEEFKKVNPQQHKVLVEDYRKSEFTTQMRKAHNYLTQRNVNEKEYAEAVAKALNIRDSGQTDAEQLIRMRASLRGHKFWTNLNEDDKAAVRKRLGEDLAVYIDAHDELVEAQAQHIRWTY